MGKSTALLIARRKREAEAAAKDTAKPKKASKKKAK